ncbi:MAG: class I SAM-dependent methyltransferase [Propionibacteriaceae bacterium]
MLPDPVDRLILDVAREHLAGRAFGRCVVLEDRAGALAGACLDEPTTIDVRLSCDSLLDERDAVAAHPSLRGRTLDDPGTLAGADLVLFRLPRSVDAVRLIAERIAAAAAPDVLVVGAARVKHMSTTMNTALAAGFEHVSASLGRAKSRALVATGPRPTGNLVEPRSRDEQRLGFVVHAEAGVFAGTRLDHGTALLASRLGRLADDLTDPPTRAVDLGCGSGVLTTLLARRFPAAAVTGIDVSAAACRSTRLTVDAAGVGGRVDVRRSVGLEDTTAHSVDLVVSNPPFHRDAAKDSRLASEMIAGAGRALRPGGELWLVWNSHLPYRPWLRTHVGPTQVVARTPAYTLTRSVAAGV